MSDIPWVDISRIIVLSQALFIGLYGLIFIVTSPLGRAITAFGFCSMAGIILRFTWDGWNVGDAYYALVIASSLTPLVVWLVTQYIFNDEFKTGPIFWLLVLCYLALNLLGRFNYANEQSLSMIEKLVIYYVPQLIKLGFALHIIFMAIQGMKNDLVEQRRRLRAPLAFIAGLLVAINIGSQMINQGYQIIIPASVEVVYNVVLAYGITLWAFRLGFSVTPGKTIDKPIAKKELDTEGLELIERKLQTLMHEQQYYLTPGITIGALAAAMDEPEYKVRRTINGKLGYRNFNQYINAMRIKDAENKLIESEASMVNIAKELGYVSLSSFNKAFRDIHQWTPSEFRAKHAQLRSDQ